MSYTTTPNLGLRYYASTATDTFDLDNALNYNWNKIDGYNPENRLAALESSPAATNAGIYRTTYTGTGTLDFTISYAAGNISTPVLVIIYSLDATVRENSLMLVPNEYSTYKSFDFNYNDACELYPPVCEFGDYQLRIRPHERSSSLTPEKLCNEQGKNYGITILGVS